MAHVITSYCCNDADCVKVCPVDAIHPRPDEPDFSSADMLTIDAMRCIDCGACLNACPVGAIYAEDDVPPPFQEFLEINAFYAKSRAEGNHAPLQFGRPRLSQPGNPVLRVAIVGSGPSSWYALSELLAVQGLDVEVDIYEKLQYPWGLIRYGVSPDHQQTKSIVGEFEKLLLKPNVNLHLGVNIGEDITHEELSSHYHGVIYAVGSSKDRALGIPGEELEGSVAATEFVAWYNGHPEFSDRSYDFSGKRAVVVGNGNVAIDVARILTTDPDELAKTDIASYALEALRKSKIEEVVILGRRGPAQAAFTLPSLIELDTLSNVELKVEMPEAETYSAADSDPFSALKVKFMADYARRNASAGKARRITLKFLKSPVALLGDAQVGGVEVVDNILQKTAGAEFSVTPTDSKEVVDTGLVVRAIGYQGTQFSGLPFDDVKGVIPSAYGRVLDQDGEVLPGTYVAGWIKRGPSGGIGANKLCALETVQAMLDDFVAGNLTQPASSKSDLKALLDGRVPLRLGAREWMRIDAYERQQGEPLGCPRVKQFDNRFAAERVSSR